MYRHRVTAIIIVLVLLSLSCGGGPWLDLFLPEREETASAPPIEVTPTEPAEPASTGVREEKPPPAAMEATTGVTERERLAAWPQGEFPVGLTYAHDYGLAFTVRQMRIGERGLAIVWQAVNRSDRTLELKSEAGQPPLLQDNTGRIYEYPAWPEREILAVEPGEMVEGEWRFGLPAYDAYRMRLGVNLLRLTVGAEFPRQPSFWTPAWDLPNPDWPRREEPGVAEDVAQAVVGDLTVAIVRVEAEEDRLVLQLKAELRASASQPAMLGWTSKPRLTGARRYVLDLWSWGGGFGESPVVLPGETWEGEVVFYPAPQEGEKLTLTLNPKPVLEESEPTVVLTFTAP